MNEVIGEVRLYNIYTATIHISNKVVAEIKIYNIFTSTVI